MQCCTIQYTPTSAVLHVYTDREAHLLYTASTLMRSPGDAVPHMPICKHNTQCGGKQLYIHATYRTYMPHTYTSNIHKRILIPPREVQRALGSGDAVDEVAEWHRVPAAARQEGGGQGHAARAKSVATGRLIG